MPIKLPSFRPRKDAYPPDLWTKCPSCSEMLFNKQLDKADRVCPRCGHHFRLSAWARLELLLDERTFQERDAGLQSVDPLGFADQKPYPDRVVAAQLATGLRDAAVRGIGLIDGRPVSICFIVMHWSTGQTSAQRLQPTHSSSMMRGTCTPIPFGFFLPFPATLYGSMHWCAPSSQAT